MFHEKCLLEAKSRKAECPNCRSALTPTQPALPAPEYGGIPQISFDHSMGRREAIINRSAAARDAVRWLSYLYRVINFILRHSHSKNIPLHSLLSTRLGNVRREHEKRRVLMEARNSNDEKSWRSDPATLKMLLWVGRIPIFIRIIYFCGRNGRFYLTLKLWDRSIKNLFVLSSSKIISLYDQSNLLIMRIPF